MMLWKLKTYKTKIEDDLLANEIDNVLGQGYAVPNPADSGQPYASVWEKELGLNPMLTNAVKRRIDMIYTSGKSEIFKDDEFDLSLHRDRQLIGYNYLEYVR